MPKPKNKKQITNRAALKKDKPAAKKKTTKRDSTSKKRISKLKKASSISKKSLPKRKAVSRRGRKKKPVIRVNRLPVVLGVIMVAVIGLLIYKLPETPFYGKVFHKPAVSKEYTYKPSYESKPVHKAKVQAKPKAKAVQAPRPVLKGPKIVFVIDDIGNTVKHQELLENLKNEVTYAVLPLLPYSRHFALLSNKTGAELILHLPIEPSGGINPGPGTLSPSMTKDEIVRQFNEDMKSVPNVSGMNNHTGSLGTADERLMGIVLAEVKSKNLIFLDSYTTPESVVLEVSKEKGVPALRRDVFLDNVNEPEAIKKQIGELAAIAKKHGSAIAIGHYRYNTLKVLNEEIPRLKKEGYRIVSLEDLID